MQRTTFCLLGVLLICFIFSAGCSRSGSADAAKAQINAAAQPDKRVQPNSREDDTGMNQAKESKSESTAGQERYKAVHDEVYVILTISESKENWSVAGDFYWTKEGANKHEGKEGGRVDGFNATNVRYDAERQVLEWDSKLEKNPFSWGDPVHSKGTLLEGRKYLNLVSTYLGGQSETRFLKD